MIRYNKFLMQKEHFPYSMPLTFIHILFSLTFCTLFYWLSPDSLPGMASTVGRRWTVCRWFVPIGLCFAIALFTSNEAYTYCNVAFLQFMKEGNVMISFLISCAVGLQVLDRSRLAIILFVVA